MSVALEPQVQVYWLTCRDLRLAREASNHEGIEEAFGELADLAAYTPREKLRRACLSHLRCDVATVGRIGVFVFVVLTMLCLADSAPGIGKFTQPPMARAARIGH